MRTQIIKIFNMRINNLLLPGDFMRSTAKRQELSRYCLRLCALLKSNKSRSIIHNMDNASTLVGCGGRI